MKGKDKEKHDDSDLLLESCRVMEDEQHARGDLGNITGINTK